MTAPLLPAHDATEEAKVAYVVASAFAIAAAVLACFVIREVSRAQERDRREWHEPAVDHTKGVLRSPRKAAFAPLRC